MRKHQQKTKFQNEKTALKKREKDREIEEIASKFRAYKEQNAVKRQEEAVKRRQDNKDALLDFKNNYFRTKIQALVRGVNERNKQEEKKKEAVTTQSLARK